MKHSRIIVVSRTKMGMNGVCVGAYDVDHNKNVRLLDANGYNQRASFDLKIGDIVIANYIEKPDISSPHTEDVMLQSYFPCPDEEGVRSSFYQRAHVVDGPITNCFDGKLFQPDQGALAMPNDNLSNHSVCFWKADRDLILNSYGKYIYTPNPPKTEILGGL